jgi:hypothetical protein
MLLRNIAKLPLPLVNPKLLSLAKRKKGNFFPHWLSQIMEPLQHVR